MAGRFLESKHKRGPNGQFAPKIGSLSSTSKRKRASIRKKQKDGLKGNTLARGERPTKLKTKLGKRVVTKLEKNSNKRASDRRKGRRTRR